MTIKNEKILEVQDILRINAKDAAEVLQQMEQETRPAEGGERRRAPRVRYQDIARLAVRLGDEQIGRLLYAMIPRNISRTGMSLLHGQFVYNGTTCVVGLKTLGGELASVRGKVGRCRLVTGRVHELGIDFDEPIELADFVASDQAA